MIGILIFEKSYHESQKVVVIEKNHALTFQKYSILILKVKLDIQKAADLALKSNTKPQPLNIPYQYLLKITDLDFLIDLQKIT